MARLSPARASRSLARAALVATVVCLGLASSQDPNTQDPSPQDPSSQDPSSQDPKGEASPPRPEVDRDKRLVRVPATLRLARFRAGSPPGHHLLTWGKGRAGAKALLETPVSDALVLAALESLGAKPGDNLREEAWTERDDPRHPAPDVRAEGPRLALFVVLPDGARRPLADLVEDLDRRGFDWRLAGNRALIPVWRSGCVVCLQSCPGSKVANARATIRDLHLGRSRFRPSKLALALGEGARLRVELALAPPPTSRPSEPEPAKTEEPR